MSTTNLSDYKQEDVPDAAGMRFGIVVSDWNEGITHALLDGAIQTLLKNGAKEDQIKVMHVPGSFELTAGAKLMAETERPDAVICLGCVIKGETPHFDYVCQGVTQGVTHLNLHYSIPFIFGVLTTNNQKQAANRAGGIHGNKGDEAAVTAIHMANLRKNRRQIKGFKD